MMKTTTRTIRPFDALDQDQRVIRARAQADEYTITPHDGSYVVEGKRGAYIVDQHTCSCDDWQYRISKVEGARCKHQCIVGAWLIEQGIAFTSPAGSSATCSHCHEPLPTAELFPVPATGELVCKLCVDDNDYVDPFDDVPPPAGPEDFHREDSLFDRLFGSCDER